MTKTQDCTERGMSFLRFMSGNPTWWNYAFLRRSVLFSKALRTGSRALSGSAAARLLISYVKRHGAADTSIFNAHITWVVSALDVSNPLPEPYLEGDV